VDLGQGLLQMIDVVRTDMDSGLNAPFR
jgi:hypothetical protein